MAGISDSFGRLCLALALWNGRDPILKERMFGLTGSEGNHGEDVKEYWWFLDALPSHALLKWRYHYPQQAFPYEDLVRTNREPRARATPSTSCWTPASSTTGTGSSRPPTPRPSPTDIVLRITARNAGPAADRIHVLPDPLVPQHVGLGARVAPGRGSRSTARPWSPTTRPSAPYRLEAGPSPDGAPPRPLFCDNETNYRRVFGAERHDALPEGRHQRPRGGRRGHGEPGRGGDEGGVVVLGRGRARRDGRVRGAPAGRRRADVLATRLGGRGLRHHRPAAGDRGRRVLRHPDPGRRLARGGRGDAAGLRRDDLVASSSTRTTWPAGWTAIRASPPRPPSAGGAATPAGATSTPRTSCPCPTPGSTRGSPPGTWPSTRWSSPTSTRRSPSTSSSR